MALVNLTVGRSKLVQYAGVGKFGDEVLVLRWGVIAGHDVVSFFTLIQESRSIADITGGC